MWSAEPGTRDPGKFFSCLFIRDPNADRAIARILTGEKQFPIGPGCLYQPAIGFVERLLQRVEGPNMSGVG